MENAPPVLHVPFPGLRLSRLGDECLAQMVGGGRNRAFAALYERYHQPLYRYCRSMMHSEADAQDALQSTFAAALGALQRGQRNAPLRPWLFRIAHNESISLVRQRQGGSPVHLEVEPPLGPAADDAAERRARLATLVADLQDLPERQRSALVMRELSGLSHADIASALGTSLGAAKQAIFDARTALAELAEGRAMACEDVVRTISDGDRRVLRGRRVRAHLRDCGTCAAFASAIGVRRTELRALAPALPPAASAALLARLVRSAPGHAAGGGSSTVAAGTAGKLGMTALTSKALVGVAVVATAAGVGGLVKVLPHPFSTAHNSLSQTADPAAGPSPVRSAQSPGGAGAAHTNVQAGGKSNLHRLAAGRSAARGSSQGSRASAGKQAHRQSGSGGSPVPGPVQRSAVTLPVATHANGGATSPAGAGHSNGSSSHATHNASQNGAAPTHPTHPTHPAHPAHPPTNPPATHQPGPPPRLTAPGGSGSSSGQGPGSSGASGHGSGSHSH